MLRTKVIKFQSDFNIFDLLLVAYSHSLFQTWVILFDLFLVQLTTVFFQFHFFFCKKKAKVIIK